MTPLSILSNGAQQSSPGSEEYAAWTPTGGSASTKHTYQIAASEVWALDKAVSEAALIAEQNPSEREKP